MDQLADRPAHRPAHRIEGAEVVLPCRDFDANLKFFTEQAGFRVLMIFPADDPATAVVENAGTRLRLERADRDSDCVIRLVCDTPGAFDDVVLVAPNGARIDIVAANPPLDIPPLDQSFVVQKLADESDWIVGRAGMQYRDLIPDREGGRFIASHIRIPDGGPVPDNVHFHKIRFQMIFCYRGWVRLVYEDQGEPFVLQAGDCVLQPPEIRHRVLECSAGLEVVEIGCPAEHLTCLDHVLPLPTGKLDPGRDFGGQRFVHHIAAIADWRPWRQAGFEARDIGIGAATDGLAGVKVVRPSGPPIESLVAHQGEFLFLFVLDGSATLATDGNGDHDLAGGDAAVIPAGLGHAITPDSDDLEFLEVVLPADLTAS